MLFLNRVLSVIGNRSAARPPLAAWALAACAGVTSFASADVRPAAGGLEVDHWRFVPLLANDGSASTVDYIAAFADTSLTTGSNLKAILYHRETAGWSAKAYECDSQWEAIKAIKSTTGVEDTWDYRWPTTDWDNGGLPAEGKDYKDGMLMDDPLYTTVVESDDRDTMIEWLTQGGYKSADIKIEQKDQPCTKDVFLSAMAQAAVDMTVSGDKPVEGYGKGVVAQPATPPAAAPPVTPVLVPNYTGTPGWYFMNCQAPTVVGPRCVYNGCESCTIVMRSATYTTPGWCPVGATVTVWWWDECCFSWGIGFSIPTPPGGCPASPPGPAPAPIPPTATLTCYTLGIR